jgi:peptidoglycan/LPS O-acetylase OafA/YrhL
MDRIDAAAPLAASAAATPAASPAAPAATTAARVSAPKLDALTSLRFFAAMMIVFHHAKDRFGIGHADVNLGQGVSFFFVLSGFILAYVYPNLDAPGSVQKFWRARVARVWPAHLAALVLGLLIIDFSSRGPTILLANILMLHAWVPLPAFNFSYNGPSWSISTELFFYVVFPWFIHEWQRTGRRKLALAFGLLVFLVAATKSLPEYASPVDPQLNMSMTQHAFLYISPLGRLFEFVCGIALAGLWRKYRDRPLPGPATAWEIAAVAGVVGMLYLVQGESWRLAKYVGGGGLLWMAHAGAMPAFAFLIYIVAVGRGWISLLLRHKALVLLGEISYSMYLIHQIIIVWFDRNLWQFAPVPFPIGFLAYTAIVLLVAYLIWRLVEMPMRRLLMGQQVIHWASARTAAPKTLRGPLIAAVALAAVFFGWKHAPAIATAPATPVPEFAGARFGDQVELRSYELACMWGSLEIRTQWARLPGNDGRKLNHAVHLRDDTGKIVGNFDYPSPPWDGTVDAAGVRSDRTVISLDTLRKGSSLAIGMYQPAAGLLPVDVGGAKPPKRMLVVSTPDCPG